MTIIDQLVYKITGDNSQFNNAMALSDKKMNTFGSTAKKVFTGLGIGLSIGVITNEVRKSIQEFTTYEQSLAKVSTLYGDIAVDQENLTRRTMEVSNATGLLSSEINEALYSALSAGVEVTNDMSSALEIAEKSARLAKAGFTDTDTALSATIKTINAYKLGLDETDRIQYILMQTQNKGITTVGELGQNLAKVTPTAAAFGVAFEDVGASLATMTAQGFRTEIATTYLSQIITELGKSGTTASEGLRLAAESSGLAETDMKSLLDSGKSLGDVLDILDQYAQSGGKSLVDMFGSVEAGKGALALTGENLETFNSNLESMYTNADLVGEGFAKMINTVAGQSSILKANLSNLRIVTGEQLEPALISVMGIINEEVLPTLVEWAGKAGNVFGFIGDVAGITAKHVQYAFDDIKDSVTNILEKMGIDTQDIAELKLSLKPFGDVWESLKEGVASGDYTKFWGSIAPAFREGVKLAVILQGAKLALTGLGLLSNTFGVAGAVAGMSIAVAFMEAQGDDNWKNFALKMALGLGAGLLAAGLTKNPATGFWVGSIVMNLDFNISPAKRDAWFAEAEKDGSTWANKFMGKIVDFLYGDGSDNIVDGISQAEDGFKEAGVDAGKAYEKGVKEALEIQSPSKVMKGVGENATEGLVEGATRPKFGAEIAAAYDKWFKQDDLVDSAEETGEDIGGAVVDGVEEALDVSFFDKIKEKLDSVKGWLGEYEKEIGYSITGVNNLSSAWSYLNQVQANNNQSELDRLKGLVDAEEEGTQARIDAQTTLDDTKKKFAQQEAKRTKAQGIAQAIIDTASAIIGFLADPGGWPGVGLSASAVAVGATQLAAINSTPIPSYEVGSINIPSDRIANVHKSEMILPANLSEQARSEGITIAPSNSNSGTPAILMIYLDGRKIAESGVTYINTGSVGKIDARVVK